MSFFHVWKKLIEKEYYLPLLLFIISIFVLSFQLNGSMGLWDESIYSEVAKEGVMRGSWLETFYQGKLWMEKPPLAIWLTMISYIIFGISEVSSRFFPVIFGAIGVVAIYYLAKLIFDRKVGFLSALILLDTPHYALMSRSNMMDIFLVVFIILSLIFFIRSFQNKKEIILSGLFFGLAFMSKSVAALIYLPLFFVYLWLKKDFSVLKSKYFIFSFLAFFAVALPWHLMMWAKYGNIFINEYFGFHVMRRFSENILGVSYAYDYLFYFKTILQRSASWWFVFLTTIPIIYAGLKNRKDSEKLKLLLIWIILVLVIFTFSVTKLHHYILSFYIPFSILIGYALRKAIKEKSFLIIPASLAVLVNMFPAIIKNAADFGEARLLIPKILILTKLPSAPLFLLLTFVLIYCAWKLFKKDFRYSEVLIFLIFIFSILLPFSPDRSPEAIKINSILVNLGAKRIYLYNTDHLGLSLVFYGYPSYETFKFKNIKDSNLKKLDKPTEEKIFCIIGNGPGSSAKFDLFPCSFDGNLDQLKLL